MLTAAITLWIVFHRDSLFTPSYLIIEGDLINSLDFHYAFVLALRKLSQAPLA